jgi:hypothetical protein
VARSRFPRKAPRPSKLIGVIEKKRSPERFFFVALRRCKLRGNKPSPHQRAFLFVLPLFS